MARRQQRAAFIQPRSVDVRSSALSVGQPVRALIKNKWLSGVVSVVCPEPNSYVVRLNDGRLFRRTRWAINVSVCDSTLNPVRPCLHRPTVVGVPTATVPVASSVNGHANLAPLSVSRQVSVTTTTASSGLCARAGQSSVAQRQQSLAPPIVSVAQRQQSLAPPVVSTPRFLFFSFSLVFNVDILPQSALTSSLFSFVHVTSLFIFHHCSCHLIHCSFHSVFIVCGLKGGRCCNVHH